MTSYGLFHGGTVEIPTVGSITFNLDPESQQLINSCR